jgi:DNA-binding transcriptional LysR family regulator
MEAAGREQEKTGKAVNHGVTHLEKHLSMKLFDRTRSSMKLTDAGRILLPAMQQVIRLLSATVGR